MKNQTDFKKYGLIIGTFVPIIFLLSLLFLLPHPTAEELVNSITIFYEKYGYITIFLAAFIESILLINIYVPASVAVVLGAILAAKGILSLPIVILLSAVGSILAYLFDFYMGKYGWYKILTKFGLSNQIEKTKEKLDGKKRIKMILISCIHPNYGAISATSAGILSWKIKEFLVWFSIAQLFWCTLWGILFYIYGYQILEMGAKYTNYILTGVLTFFTIKGIQKLRLKD